MPWHFRRGGKILYRVINWLPLTFAGHRRGRSVSLAPSSKFCRRCSGFHPTAFLSRTVVQGSVLHSVRLSPCQPTSTWQGENEVSPKSAGNWWCGVHQRWVNFVQVRPDRLRSTPLIFWIEKSPPAKTIYLSAAFTSPSKKLKVF